MVSADECIIVWGYRCSTLGSCQSGGVKRNILADHICRICDVFPGFLGGVLFAMNTETTMDELEINKQTEKRKYQKWYFRFFRYK